MESRVTDMTSGKPSKLILKFALPLIELNQKNWTIDKHPLM